MEIISLYAEKHMGLVNIGKVFKVSRRTIQRILETHNVSIRNMSDCHRGQKAWNKGKHWPEEIRKKLSLKAQGRTGQNNPNWKGGIAWKQDRRRNWKIVKEWRKRCLIRDSHTCLWCGSQLKVEVNHIVPIREIQDIDLLVDLNNGITLCRQCHNKIHYHEDIYTELFKTLLKNHVNSGEAQNG